MRTITVTLTEAQYGALAAAVALLDAEIDQDGPGRGAERRALRNGWTKVNEAWHGRRR